MSMTDQDSELPRNGPRVVPGVLDARVLYAAHPNQTVDRRTVITLWYCPHFEAVSEPLRAAMAHKWHEHQRRFPSVDFAKLLPASHGPRYDGNAEPLKQNRNPNAALR